MEAYFGLYQAHKKQGDTEGENFYKNQIIELFPNSRYATILSDPDYVAKLEMAKNEQDSLYEASYKAYMKGEYNKVTANYDLVMSKYPDTKLKPNFMFLNTLITGVNDSVSVFRAALEELTTTYPKERVSEQAKNILAQLDAGKTPSGSAPSLAGLFGKRSDLLEQMGMEQFDDSLAIAEGTSVQELFNYDEDARHFFVMLIPTDKIDENQFLYEVARFNFTKFLIKDFELSWMDYNPDTTIMVIDGFNGIDEALWYQRTFILEESLYDILSAIPYERLVVSDRNFRALITTRDLKAYKAFYDQNIRLLEGTIQDPEKKEESSYNEPPGDALHRLTPLLN